MYLFNDAFVRRGTDLKTFSEIVQEIDKYTINCVKNLSTIELLGIKKGREGFVTGQIGYPKSYTTGVLYKDLDEDILESQLKNSPPLISIPEFGTSFLKGYSRGEGDYDVIEEIARILGLSGSVLHENSDARNLYINHLIKTSVAKNKKKITLCCRYDEKNDVCKVFGVKSAKFSPIQQHLLSDAAEKITADMFSTVEWEITQKKTTLRMFFPLLGEEYNVKYSFKKNVLPGIELNTSSFGYCSTNCRPIWKIGETIIEADGLILNTRKSAEEDVRNIDLDDFYNNFVLPVIGSFSSTAENMAALKERECSSALDFLNEISLLSVLGIKKYSPDMKAEKENIRFFNNILDALSENDNFSYEEMASEYMNIIDKINPNQTMMTRVKETYKNIYFKGECI